MMAVELKNLIVSDESLTVAFKSDRDTLPDRATLNRILRLTNGMFVHSNAEA